MKSHEVFEGAIQFVSGIMLRCEMTGGLIQLEART